MTKSPDFDIPYSQYVDLLVRCVANTLYKDPPLAPGEIGNSIAKSGRLVAIGFARPYNDRNSPVAQFSRPRETRIRR
jgi:hypothetical protein